MNSARPFLAILSVFALTVIVPLFFVDANHADKIATTGWLLGIVAAFATAVKIFLTALFAPDKEFNLPKLAVDMALVLEIAMISLSIQQSFTSDRIIFSGLSILASDIGFDVSPDVTSFKSTMWVFTATILFGLICTILIARWLDREAGKRINGGRWKRTWKNFCRGSGQTICAAVAVFAFATYYSTILLKA